MMKFVQILAYPLMILFFPVVVFFGVISLAWEASEKMYIDLLIG